MIEVPVYVGLDAHKDSIIGTTKDEQGNPVRVLKVPTNEEGVKKLLQSLRIHPVLINLFLKG